MRTVLHTFIDEVGLTENHRCELLEHRQLPESHIDGRFASGDPTRVAKALQRLAEQDFGEQALRQAHLLDQHGQPAAHLVDDRILIAYHDEAGEVFHLRAHKRHPDGAPLEVYGRECLAKRPPRVVIVEGEFGAAALLARGVPALAVPGVSSFIGSRYDDLLDPLRRAEVREVVVAFDSEDKVNERLPSGQANERYKPDVNRRYDVERCAITLANRLTWNGISTKIATLPAAWRDETGKADIDGVLRLGRTIEELQEVFSAAVTVEDYLAALSEKARQVVRRQLCEDEPRFVGGMFRYRRGRLCIEARPAGRRTFETTLFDAYRPVHTDHGQLGAASFRKRFAEASTGRLPPDAGQTMVEMVDVLALKAAEKSARSDETILTTGQCVQIGALTAVLREGGLWVVRNDKGRQHEEQVANFTLEFIEDRTIDDGIEPRREIVGVVDGPEGRTDVVVPASALGSPSEFAKVLFEQLGASINIYGGRRGAEIVLQTALESSRATMSRTVKMHGWGTGDLAGIYLTPTGSFDHSGPVDVPVTVSLDGERVAEHLGLHWIDDEALRDLGRHLMSDFLDQHDRSVTMPLLGHVFLAPAISKLGSISWPMLQLRGPSGTRKSTLARCAQSFFGDFVGEDSLETWRSTPNAIQRSGHFMRDAVFVVDDLKNDNVTDQPGTRSILQLYADRGSRGRLHRSATKHGVSYAIRGLLLITGEDSIDDRASIAARRLTLEVGEHEGLEAGRCCLERCGEYPGFMARYVSWLARFGFEHLQFDHRDLMEELGSGLRGIDNAPRIASNLAANSLGFHLLLSFLLGQGVIERREEDQLLLEHHAILRDLGQRTASTVRETAGTDLFLDVLRDLLAAGEVAFSSHPGRQPKQGGRAVGFDKGGDDVRLLFEIAFASVEEHLQRQNRASIGLGKVALRHDLQQRGLIRPAGQARHNGTRPRVWYIQRNLLGLEPPRTIPLDYPGSTGSEEFVN